MTRQKYEEQVKKTLDYFEKANIKLTEKEKSNIEIADFGKNMIDEIGLQLLVYVNTERVCAKEWCSFRVRPARSTSIYLPAESPGKRKPSAADSEKSISMWRVKKNTEKIKASVPASEITVFHEIVLRPGEQYTIQPETLHWFQAGKEGAVISEFSTRSTDETDIFTDKSIIR